MTTPRSLALRSVTAWRKNGKYANLEVNAVLDRSDLSAADRALYTAMVYGVVERAVTLDYIIAGLSTRPVEQIDPQTLSAVELGLYQLLYLDRVPDHAAVDETVAACPRESKAFVNAILRSFIRKGKRFDLPTDPDERLSVEYSLPLPLVRFFGDAYPGRTAAIAEAFLKRHRTALRVNTLRTTAEECLASLGDAAEPSPYCGDVILFSGDGETLRDGIARGLWFVEDTSSRLAVRVLDPKPGSLLCDVCAAPGGKSFSAAIDMENSGEVRSFDLHENKLSLIRSGAERLGITIITAEANDARTPRADLVGKADFVLCDAPCSGLGVIGKKPDIKYKDLAEAARLPQIQSDILAASASLVRPGGTIVYSTCTLNPAENEGVFARFIAEHPDFSPVDFDAAGKTSTSGALTFFPDEGEYDGFFVAKARRKD